MNLGCEPDVSRANVRGVHQTSPLCQGMEKVPLSHGRRDPDHAGTANEMHDMSCDGGSPRMHRYPLGQY